MKNIQHLKAYVTMHPDNKMAWYLLGKEYDKNGQQGKANYCYNQSGEVYEAFERSKVPAEMLREYEDRLLQASRERDLKRKKIRRALVALVLLVLVAIPSAAAPGALREWEADVAATAGDSATEGEGAAPAVKEPADVSQPAKAKLAFTAVEGGGAASAGAVLARMLGDSPPAARTAVLGMERSGNGCCGKSGCP